MRDFAHGIEHLKEAHVEDRVETPEFGTDEVVHCVAGRSLSGTCADSSCYPVADGFGRTPSLTDSLAGQIFTGSLCREP
jgi:hypothetical protein